MSDLRNPFKSQLGPSPDERERGRERNNTERGNYILSFSKVFKNITGYLIAYGSPEPQCKKKKKEIRKKKKLFENKV